MESSGLMFIFMFLLMQCEIADVVASASTTSSPMSPRATLFGSTIIKTYSSNLTSAGSSAIQRTAGNTSDSAATGCSKQDSSSTRIDKQQTSILLDESKRRIWCFGPHADSKVKNQRYYLPVRFLSVLRRKDMIILPGNHQPIREFVDFVVPLLGLSHDQIIWTDGNSVSIDADIDAAILNGLKERILLSGQSGSFGSNWVLVPYCVTKDFLGWSSGLCKQFSGGNHHDAKTISSGLDDGEEKVPVQERGPGLEVFGETELWNSKYGHKGILHRHIADLSVTSIIEDIDKGDAATSALTALESIATTVAKGYQCSTVEHLLEAYKLLKKETFDDRAVIKPITGCAGWGIVFIDSVEELLNYDFPMGEVLLEEMLNLDLTEDGHVISPAVHYLGQNLFGGQLVDQLMKSTTYLGWRESKADPIFQKKVLDMTEKLLRFTQPKVCVTIYERFYPHRHNIQSNF